MLMCWTEHGEAFEDMENRLDTYFHVPGEAEGYIERVRVSVTL